MSESVFSRRRALIAGLVGGCLLGLTACGTILYPERRGQAGGRIDPAVAILDGIGLLFFLVPGVIAFAVDFTTGTIYLPRSAAAGEPDLDALQQRVRLEGERLDAAAIQAVVLEYTGQRLSLDDPRLRIRAHADAAWQPIAQGLEPEQRAALQAGAPLRWARLTMPGRAGANGAAGGS